MQQRLDALRSVISRLVDPVRPAVRFVRTARRVRGARRAAVDAGQVLVHVIGDSHTAAFRDTAPYVVHHLGPTTAFNLGSRSSSTGSSESLRRALRWVRRDEGVFLVFGEIDCRVHVNDQFLRRNGEVPHHRIIEEVVAAFVPVVLDVAAEHRVAVMGVPPASRQRVFFGYPTYADDATRIVINRTFNGVLGARLEHAGIPFIDVAPMATDHEGFLAPELSDDRLHYNGAVLPAVNARLAAVFGAGGHARR